MGPIIPSSQGANKRPVKGSFRLYINFGHHFQRYLFQECPFKGLDPYIESDEYGRNGTNQAATSSTAADEYAGKDCIYQTKVICPSPIIRGGRLNDH